MAENAHKPSINEEEERLRDRLKAKKERRDSDRSHSIEHHRSSPPDRRRSHSRDRHRRSRSRERGPPRHYRPPPPPGYYDHRRGPPRDSHRRSRSPPSRSHDDFGRQRPRRGQHSPPRRSRSRDRRRSRSYSPSSSSSSSSSLASSDSSIESARDTSGVDHSLTKDQRTVFVSQLVQRATESDVRRYFKTKGLKVNAVILLRDRRSAKHKGGAYVELRNLDDVDAAVALAGVVPDFQRFPIMVKASEAEKNYVASKTQATVTAEQFGVDIPAGPLMDEQGRAYEAQKVYVGSLAPTVTAEQLYALFCPFGALERVAMQMESSTGVSKGFAFLSFRDAKEANLAIQSMANQNLAGRPLKTGWANQVTPGLRSVTDDGFPPDAAARTQQAYQVLAQLSMGLNVSPRTVLAASSTAGSMTTTTTTTTTTTAPAAASGVAHIPTVAEARATLTATGAVSTFAVLPASPAVTVAAAASAPASPDPTQIGRADRPTRHLLVHNMFDKDQETEPDWPKMIKEEFIDECSKFGAITGVWVMDKEIGGKIYASFAEMEGAKSCASSLAGRWFDKRQLRVEYVDDKNLPKD